MEEQKFATIKEIVEYGLDTLPEHEMIHMNLKDFMYVTRVLEEYIRFFHNPIHYPAMESIDDFLGSITSGGGFEVLHTAIYEKIYMVKLPPEIQENIEDSVFQHPLVPKYYFNDQPPDKTNM